MKLFGKIESFGVRKPREYCINSEIDLAFLEAELAIYGRGSITPGKRKRIMDGINDVLQIAANQAKARYAARHYLGVTGEYENPFPFKLLIYGLNPDGSFKSIEIVKTLKEERRIVRAN